MKTRWAPPPKEIWMELHEQGRKRLAKLMVLQDVSQRELAHAIGWKSHSYLGRLLRGDVKTLDPEAAIRIAHYFDVVELTDLFFTRASSDSRHCVKRNAA